MRAVAKILRARASEHSSNFCEQFEQRPNFESTLKFSETIRYPLSYGPSFSIEGVKRGFETYRMDRGGEFISSLLCLPGSGTISFHVEWLQSSDARQKATLKTM